MSYSERYCYNCSHWKWKGAGYCALYSCACATAIGNHTIPPRFDKAEDAADLPKQERAQSTTKIDIDELYRKIAALSR